MAIPESEMRKLVAAYKANNLKELDSILESYLPEEHKHKSQNEKEKLCFVIACGKGLDDIVKKYLSLRSYDNNTLYTALSEATSSGDLDTVRILIEQCRLNPNKVLSKNEDIFLKGVPVPEGQCPIPFLALAAGMGHKEVVRYLLAYPGIEINKTFDTTNQLNVTALCGAMRHPEIAQMLLEHGADPYISMELVKVTSIPNNAYGWTLERANKRLVGKTTVFEMAISDELENGDHTLSKVFRVWEAKQNLSREVRSQKRGDSSSEHSSSGSNSPMSLGSANNSPNGSPPKPSAIVRSSPPDSPVASRDGSPPGSPMQKSDSSSSGSAGSSPERVAAIKQTAKEKAAELLKAANNDPDEALLKAMSNDEKENDLEVQKLLVDSGVTFKEVKGMSVLYAGVSRGRFELIKYMFLKFPNLNINMRTKSGKTILHGACCNDSSPELIRYLLDKGVNINAQDINGLTALHCLNRDGALLVEELVLRGANPLLTNNKGQTPLKWIEEEIYNDMRGNEKVIKLLSLLRKVTDEAQKKQQASQPQFSSSRVMSTPPEIQYRAPANKPVVDDKPSYGTSSSVMFQRSGTSQNASAAALPIAVSSNVVRPESKQVGAMYVPPPLTLAQLPRPIKKPYQIIEPPPAAVHSDNKKATTPSVVNKLKGLLSK